MKDDDFNFISFPSALLLTVDSSFLILHSSFKDSSSIQDLHSPFKMSSPSPAGSRRSRSSDDDESPLHRCAFIVVLRGRG
jgi:hypothetical protein